MNSINNIRVTENPITVKDLASDSWKVVPVCPSKTKMY